MCRIACLVCLFLLLIFSNIQIANAQCDINTGCFSAVTLSVNPPVFNAVNQSIDFNNINIGNFECLSASYKSGLVFYIYQLLPDGSRMYQCNVDGASPFNVVGSISLGFGPSSFCGSVIPIGNITADSSNGFIACDGARYEAEAVLYITNNINFDALNTSVYNQLNSTEYHVLNLGTLDVNINNEFPGNGQPLTTAVINDYNTGSNGPINLTCGQDIELYVEGLSRISNCPPYNDIGTGIPSELTNNFYYSINGGSPITIENTSTGAAGGQLTGPDPGLANLCYAGILSDSGPYVLSYADLPSGICNGTQIVFTLQTTDSFTGITVQDQIIVNYSGAACVANCCANVDLNLNFDAFPNQTSWAIFNANNMVVASGGTYSGQAGLSILTEGACLSDGCYTLVVNDAFNNGMCPFQSSAIGVSTFITPGTLIAPGSIVGTLSLVATPGLCGSYNLQDANGTTLASGGGAFGASQGSSFCLQNGLAPKVNPSVAMNVSFKLWPNPVEDILNINALNINTFQLRILDVAGNELYSALNLENRTDLKIDVQNLPSGFYFVELITEDDIVVTEKFIK